ncbi:MAG: histidine phosphatase family protein [Clostridia bacterium]|nr:histidine phosphatase family protein [Clostridia bacterium]
MRLYAARHGETEYNAQFRVCGLTDLELTEKGKEQARELAENVRDKNIDLIISSPLKRAVTTGGIVAEKLNVPVIYDKRIIEHNYGIYEGKSGFDENFMNNKRNLAYRYPQGESVLQVAHRVYGFIDEIKEKYKDKNVLLVCHGGICRVIRTYFTDMTTDEFVNYYQSNCGFEEYILD